MKICVDLGVTKTNVIALDKTNNGLFWKRVTSPKGYYHQIVNLIVWLVSHAEAYSGQQCKVAVGIPRMISLVSDSVKNANSTWTNGRPLLQDLTDSLGLEVRIANDANCLTVSEAVDGFVKGDDIVFAAILGTGCGAGVAINGKAHIGRNRVAGEWVSNPLQWLDQDEQLSHECCWGRFNCLETRISGPVLSHSYQRLTGKTLSAEHIVENAQRGTSEAIDVLQQYERRLARALAKVVNTLDPDVIVLGGGMSNIGRLYSNLPELLPEWVFGGECYTPVLKSTHRDSRGVRGATFLWD